VLDRERIRALIPHDDGMCLLERVIRWDATAIECGSRSHRSADNPLRHEGRIAAVCGIEYCLQAMAVHGALRAAASQPIGYLVRIGDIRLAVEFLDELGGELVVRAELEQAVTRAYSYSFTLSGVDRVAAVRGRATIALAD
jgi:predicted hotdog family 3-hydroxylacyl-ACP dehydratase